MLRIPHARRTFGAALLGRLSYGTVGLSLILAAKEATGSLSTAGVVMALYGLANVLLSPARAALIDRHGPRRALPPMAAVYALTLAALAAATWRANASDVLLEALALAAGASTPPLGPVMRTLWSDLVSDPSLLRRAYSLDGVAEEVLYVTGPLLVGLLVKVAMPSVGLLVSAALVLSGSLALVTSPVVRDAAAPGRASAASAAPNGSAGQAGGSGSAGSAASTGPADGSAPTASGSAAAADACGGTGSGAVPVPVEPAVRRGSGLPQAVIVSVGVGMALGALDLLVIAFADQHHHPDTVAWSMAALSGGSVIGGLAYGAVPWRGSAGPRLSLLAAALGLTLAATGLASHPAAVIAGMAVGGLFVAPALTTAYLIADESAGADARTRAGAWVNTAFNAGSAGASVAAGVLVGRLPLALCFALAAVPVVLSAVGGLVPRRGSDARAAGRRVEQFRAVGVDAGADRGGQQGEQGAHHRPAGQHQQRPGHRVALEVRDGAAGPGAGARGEVGADVPPEGR
ncbi:MFS transporter [Streptomyces palmae]|uniref:MFS transporter n=1 Tax=Streptomyces palmae TaxID=1701085 RepID=UPI001AE0010A|nr:MFS transporter [Streptomyces palmae]